MSKSENSQSNPKETKNMDREYISRANTCIRKRKHDQAIEHLQKALKIRLDKLGPDHPDVATIYNQIAWNYERKWDYGGAIECYHKDLKIRLAQLGPDHPDVAESYNKIARLCQKNGDDDQAVDYYQKYLKIRLAKREPDDPHIAIIYKYIVVPEKLLTY